MNETQSQTLPGSSQATSVEESRQSEGIAKTGNQRLDAEIATLENRYEVSARRQEKRRRYIVARAKARVRDAEAQERADARKQAEIDAAKVGV